MNLGREGNEWDAGEKEKMENGKKTYRVLSITRSSPVGIKVITMRPQWNVTTAQITGECFNRAIKNSAPTLNNEYKRSKLNSPYAS